MTNSAQFLLASCDAWDAWCKGCIQRLCHFCCDSVYHHAVIGFHLAFLLARQ
jgi:hypothetical protein